MAVAVLFTASCAKEDISSSIVGGGEVEMTFTANLQDLGTRAVYGDGSQVNTLRYYVYDGNNLLTELSGEQSISVNNPATVTLALLKGMTYNIVFWADCDKIYAYDQTNKTVSVDYTKVKANDEKRDAFYKFVAAFNPATARAEDTNIVLTRPFAQLNTISTDDLEDLGKSGVNLTTSTITLDTYSTFNLADGAVSDLREDTTLEVGNVLANGLLSMNYLFAPADGYTTEVALTINNNKTINFGNKFNYVPLKRNYRTNIIGKLLTAGTNFSVEINPGFATAENTIFTAFEKGGEVTLTEDITIAEPLVVAAGVKAVLNLNGHNIINTTASEVFGEGEGIIAYGDLTINGTGTVQGTTMAVWARGNDGAKVTINGGTYKGCAEGFAFGGRSVIYASSGNVITINGGYFESLAADKSSYANTTEGVYAALNIADNNGDIKVYGGSFYKQNPVAPGTEPAAWNAAHPNGFVAEGYTANANGDWFEVTVDSANYVIVDGKQTEGIIAVSNKTYLGVNNANVPYIHLNGADNVTIKNITFDAENAVMAYSRRSGTNTAVRNANILTGTKDYNPNKGAFNITIDGCTFQGNLKSGAAAIAFADDGRNGYSCDITIKNCTFNTKGVGYDIYGYYCGDHFKNSYFNIENNTFSSEFSQGGPICLFSYASGKPVVVKKNTFENVTSFSDATYITSNSTLHTVSFTNENNTFAQ